MDWNCESDVFQESDSIIRFLIDKMKYDEVLGFVVMQKAGSGEC